MIETQDDIERALAALQDADPQLAGIIARVPLVPLRRSRADLPALVSTIVAQQVSRASAAAIFARLSALVDLTDPAALVAASPQTLRAAGLSGAKDRTLRALGTAIVEGRLELAALADGPAEAAVRQMIAVPGIGRWTAECHLLFAQGREDVFPAGDLALQIAAAHALGLAQRPREAALRAHAERWAPHRATAARLLWAYYEHIAGAKAGPPTPPSSSASSLTPGPLRAGFTKLS